MDNRTLLLFFCIGVILIVSAFLCYYIYSLVLIDAKARGLERPKLWAFVSIGGQSGQELLLYLFKRRNYEVQLSRAEQAAMDQIKRKIFAFFAIDLIAVIFFVFAGLPRMF